MTTSANPGAGDVLALGKTVLTAFSTALDAAITGTSAEVPKLVGDEVTFGEQFLQTHATGYGLELVDGALTFGGLEIASGEAALTKVAQSALADLKATVDVKLSAFAAVA